MLPNAARQEQLFGSLLGELRGLGYTGDLLRRKYVFQDWFSSGQPFREVAAVTFGQTPVSYGTSCFAVVKADGRPGPELIAEHRALGAPIAFEVWDDRIVEWGVTTTPSAGDQRRVLRPNELPAVFNDVREAWSPTAVLRAKNIFEKGARQIELDFGLIPTIESEIRARLDPLLREILAGAEDLSRVQGKRRLSPADLFRLVFWFLAGKVLHDREIEPFGDLSATGNAREVLSSVAAYYHEAAPSAAAPVLEFVHQRLWSGFDFRNLSIEVLAIIYENTLVDQTLRQTHGIHATPPSLARYIVNQLSFETFKEDERTVMEPCCGHGTFLLAAMHRLRELLPPSMSPLKRHEYFKKTLAGFEIDPFALEVSRLSLMLADFPNQDGWQLYGGEVGDVFRSPKFAEEMRRTNIVLFNPPFVRFSPAERHELKVRSVNMPAEILHRVLDDISPAGVIGFIAPHMFLDGQEYRSARKRLVERYDEIQVVSLPDQGVFEQAEIETALVIAKHPREKTGDVHLSHLKVDKMDWPRFRAVFEPSRSNDVVVGQTAAAANLRIADLHDVWERLNHEPVLGDIAAQVARGIEWNISLERNRDLLISSTQKNGFLRGLESKAAGFYAFQKPATSFLCVQPKYRLYRAYDLPWDQPKVVINSKRRRRGRWRLTAFAETTGLLCYQTFTCIWPEKGWSPTVIAALLNGPIANCYVASHESTRDITNETLNRIPVPRAEFVDVRRLEALVEEYIATIDRMPLAASTSERTAADVLNDIDDEVVRSYRLSISDARAISEYLRGSDRAVPEDASLGGWWLRSVAKFSIEMRPAADAVLKALGPSDRMAVLSAIDKLRDGPSSSVVQAQKIRGSQELYVLRASDSLRVIFLARPDRTIRSGHS